MRTIATIILLVVLTLGGMLGAEGMEEEGTCTVNRNYVYEGNATARFALLISLRKDDVESGTSGQLCSTMSQSSLQVVLAVEWVVARLNQANNGSGFIPGIRLGFDEMDDCRSSIESSRNALSFMDKWQPQTVTTCPSTGPETLHMGIVGPSRSSSAVTVSSLLRDVKIPIVSFSATVAELSNKAKYPNTLRTVPSDHFQMKLIADILDQLSWSYVVIIYENDTYGASAADILEQRAEELGICIHAKTVLPDHFLKDLIRDLETILTSTKDSSLAIIFIGQRDKAEQFLWLIDKTGTTNLKYGFHLILTDAANVDVTVFDNKNFGQGTISIAPSDLFLEDLYQDLTEKFRLVKEGTEHHQLIEEYISQNEKGELFSGRSHNSYVALVVHAVFAMVTALQEEHKAVCDKPGLCSTLLTNVAQGNLLDQVFNVKVDYGSMERGTAPDAFIDGGFTLSFDAHGDMVNSAPSYTIHQYNHALTAYQDIGNFTNEKTTLATSKMRILLPDGSPSDSIPTSMCATRCDDCLKKGRIPVTYIEGDAYILGVFSLHQTDSKDPFMCGDFRSFANDAIAVEGFLFAVRDLRNRTGIPFGAIAIDACYSPLRSTSLLSGLFSNIIKSDSDWFSFRIPRDKLVGVVACRSSGCTIPTASFFMLQEIPVVSYASSSPDLDDKVDFPYFLRTVPSDIYQAQVMVSIVKQMGWEYVGLLYVQNNYGTKGMQAFKAQAMLESSGICVATEVGITEEESDLDSNNFFSAWKELIKQDVKVVIFFGIDDRYRAMLKYMEQEELHGRFIFLASEDWGNNPNILNAGPKSARGSLTLKLQSTGLESLEAFRKHLRLKTPSVDDNNVWFMEFWQNFFQCYFEGGFNNNFGRLCDPSWRLSEQEVTQRTSEQRPVHVMNAVYALGRGIEQAKKTMCESSFPCKYLRENVDQVVALVKEQTRREGSFTFRIFDENGNGAIGFDLFNIQQDFSGFKYVKVGTFNSKEANFRTKDVKFYSSTGNIMNAISAKCTESLCRHCTRTKADIPTEDRGSSSPATAYRDADILIISLIIVLILAVGVALAAIVVCLRRNNALKKNVDKQKEQIYDEIERKVYQGDYFQSHGLKFQNLMSNPYQLEGSSVINSHSHHRGETNPIFTTDNVDSVSQVYAPSSQTETRSVVSQPEFRNRIGIGEGRADSLPQPPRFLPLEFMGRHMPMSVISGGGCAAAGVSGSHRTGSEHSMPNGHLNAGFYASSSYNPNASDVGDGEVRDIPTSFSPAASNTGKGESSSTHKTSLRPPSDMRVFIPNEREGLVYYMQDSHGQLTAHVSPPVSELRHVFPVQGEEHAIIAQQSPNPSENSSAVNAGYGPYSYAFVQQRQRQNLTNLPPLTSPLLVTNGNYGMNSKDNIKLQQTNPQDTEYQNEALNLPQASKISQEKLSEAPVEYSPVLYASPPHNQEEVRPDFKDSTEHMYPTKLQQKGNVNISSSQHQQDELELKQESQEQKLQYPQQQQIQQHQLQSPIVTTKKTVNNLDQRCPHLQEDLESVDICSGTAASEEDSANTHNHVNKRVKHAILSSMNASVSKV